MRERSATGVPIRTLEHTQDHMYHYILLHAIWLIPTVLPAALRLDRFPASLLVEVRRDYNALKSGELFFSGFHS